MSFDKAEHWYRRCVDFDMQRADCPVFLSKLYRQHHLLDQAWTTISYAIKSPFEERRFSNNFYIYHCSLPLEASLTLLELLPAEPLPGSHSPTFLFGWRLLRTAQTNCNSTSLGYLLENEEAVAAAEAAYRAIAARVSGAPADKVSLMIDDACVDSESSSNAELIGMLQSWGVGLCSRNAT